MRINIREGILTETDRKFRPDRIEERQAGGRQLRDLEVSDEFSNH